MHETHRTDFADAMTILAEALDVELTVRRMETYWTVLNRFEWPAVERALHAALERKWFKFPQPGELIELIEGTPTERQDEAESAWRQLWKALDHGTYRSLFCEDRVLAETIRDLFGGWPQAGELPRADSDQGPMYQVRHKEFLAAYANLRRQGHAYDPYLPGRIERDNTAEQLAAFGQGAMITYLPRRGTADAIELRALLPDHPLAVLTAAQARQALPEGNAR